MTETPMNEALTTSEQSAGSPAWWETAVGYEIYIRSFNDGNGDGIGDFEGLTDRLDYLAWLGVDIIWVTPFYPSPMADFGYDVADYVGVDSRFGDMAALDAMVAKAHDLGLRVIVDVVPNHSSDQHVWFQESRSSIDNPKRDWYLWRDPAPDGGPPNNWITHFGGQAWTLDEATGQYYCHLFLPEQPDLNWRNPEVVEAWDQIIRFWLDRGVDGFRIDVTQGLVKDAELRSNPQLRPLTEGMGRNEQWDSFEHLYDTVQPESLEIYRRWNAICAEYDAFMIGETYVADAVKLNHFLTPRNGVHAGFWFQPMHMDWTPEEIIDKLKSPIEAVGNGVGWVLSSHDDPRAPTRYAHPDFPTLGADRALGLFTLMSGLPGTPFLYMGDELGLVDAVVPDDRLVDPVIFRTGVLTDSRDRVRTPMPWSPEPGFGFTTSDDPWLPFGGRTDADTVAVQKADSSSYLHRWRALLSARRAIVNDASFIADAPSFFRQGDLVGFDRGGLRFMLNTSTVAIDPGPDLSGSDLGQARYRSGEGEEPLLAAGEAVIVPSPDRS